MILIFMSCAIFALGLYGVLTRRDLIGVLACVELMLGSATVLLVGLATTVAAPSGGPVPGVVEGVGLFVIALAAAEAAVGLALVVCVSRRVGTTRSDELTEVKG
ncbi:MAG: NADH-quinone oxidoreductase subunit NuoK [Coriobacteriia bacterium]|nr:NADH-quinone oxidoreductase subunit NuoK [Coriobacteriia bacterium]